MFSLFLNCNRTSPPANRSGSEAGAPLMLLSFATGAQSFGSIICSFTLCGALLFFLQDSSDAMLEMAKIGMYMRRRTNGTYYKYIDFARSVIFVLFAANSILCRLYWYPCKLLYGTSYGAVYLGPQIAAFFPVLGVMLVLIYALNLYWFNEAIPSIIFKFTSVDLATTQFAVYSTLYEPLLR